MDNNNSSTKNVAVVAFDKACRYGIALVTSAISIGASSLVAPPSVTAAFAAVAFFSAVGLFQELNKECKKAKHYGGALAASAILIGVSSFTAPPLATAAFAVAASVSASGLFQKLSKGHREVVRLVHE